MSPTQKLWSKDDVAEYLGVKRPWVNRYTSNGILPSLKIGGLRRYDPAAIIEWAASQKRRSA